MIPDFATKGAECAGDLNFVGACTAPFASRIFHSNWRHTWTETSVEDCNKPANNFFL